MVYKNFMRKSMKNFYFVTFILIAFFLYYFYTYTIYIFSLKKYLLVLV